MALFGLLTRGIEAVLAEPATEAELQQLLTESQVGPEAVSHVAETLRAMPGLLVLMQESLTKPDIPSSARSLFLATVGYLLRENDLIPSHEGKPLYGLLDDVYLLHLAAYELRDFLGRVDERSVAGGLRLLETILPREVIVELQGRIRQAASAS